MSPLVTIGCAVYNGEATLRRALDPVIEQDYENLEILISDDGSTDGSPEIYEEYARRDRRVRILRAKKNGGVAENFNRIVRAARGAYIMWADQDDIRDRTFVSKAVAALEADPEAVLCHSHTGVFVGDSSDIKYILSLGNVADVSSLVRRYHEFLWCFSDTVVYGLIRTAVLRDTRLWRSEVGSANALLFELLLRGKFIELPETLYFYSGRGMRKRPTVEEEYARVNPGQKPPRLYFPFLIVARNQTADILNAPITPLQKVELGAVLWAHTSAVAMTKLVYRTLRRRLGDSMPAVVTEACSAIVEPMKNITWLNNADRDEETFPKHWFLNGGTTKS